MELQKNQRNPCLTVCSVADSVFLAFHQIFLPGNIFGILILDMGEGVGEDFFLTEV